VSGYEIASLTEIESVKAVGTLRWTPLRKHFGITAFGISAYTAGEAGQDVVEEHTEESLGHEELYVVVAGRATFVLDGEEKDVPAGSVVFLRDPKVKRYARAEEPGTTVLAIGGKPGAHEVSAWEYFFAAYGVVDEDPERAVAEIQAGLAEKPDHAGLHFPPGVHLRSHRPPRRGRCRARPSARAGSQAPEVGGRGRGSRAATNRPEGVARLRARAARAPDPPPGAPR
jgi:mannose-6-phosphate isomerase-like protein (cupin superfamily)